MRFASINATKCDPLPGLRGHSRRERERGKGKGTEKKGRQKRGGREGKAMKTGTGPPIV